MHEVSICQNIIKSLEEELTEDQYANVREVHLKVGLLSCVEPMFIEHIFKLMTTEGPFKDCRLCCERTDIIAGCDECHHQFKVENFRFICPQCGQPTSNIIQGNELQINKIVLEQSSYEEVNQ